ncbi:MAG: hypothetical protein V1888_02715 [archaeon]
MKLYDVEFVYDKLNDAQVDEFRALQESYEMDIFTNPIEEGEYRKLKVTREHNGFVLDSVGGHIDIANIKLKDRQWNEYKAGDFVVYGAEFKTHKITIRSNSLEKRL